MSRNQAKVVTVSGGSGGFTVLRGLREYPIDITALCTVYDSGGSTGVLRDEYGALPSGDIRRCVLALVPDTDDRLRQLLMYRFENNGHGLSDHSLGNLMLLGAERLWGRLGGIKYMSELFHTRGSVLPISTDSAHLMAELSDGTVLKTESMIDTRNPVVDHRTIAKVWLDPPTTACRDTIQSILEADVIVVGPGDLYTSIIPNLLTRGVVDAINESSARIVFVVNIMTKGAETRGYHAADFVTTFCSYGVERKIDTVVINNASIPKEMHDYYWEEDRAELVICTDECRHRLTYVTEHIIEADILSKTGLSQQLVRHSSKRLARILMDIIEHG